MSVLAALADLVLPRSCLGCGGQAGPLCPRCLPAGPPLVVPGHGVPVWAGGAYVDALRAALLAYKERGRRDLAGPLAALLRRAVTAALTAERAPPVQVLLVPVPSARSVAAARGGDHVLRLARRAAFVQGVRVARHALQLTRAVRDSAGLSSGERAVNLAHAMAARPPLPGAAAVIVDDIVTTGATLREAVRALEAGGWPVIGCAVVAATQRRVMAPIGRAQPHGLA